ncbi:serine/threonine protein kinase, partial [Streptosporangium canum]
MGDFNPLLPEDPERVGVHILVGRLSQDPQQAVYLGHLPDDDTLRVIRVLAPRPEATPQAREQITNGLHAAKRVSGAHTAKLIEVGWSDDSPYIVREHVEGRSLRQAVAADGPLTGDALEHLAVTTLTALTAIHLAGLTHGALTPDTVILGPDGPRVCDIGLGATDAEPDYRAPENLHAEPALISGPPHAEPPQADASQAEPPHAEPPQAAPSQVGPPQAESPHTEPPQADASQAGPPYTELSPATAAVPGLGRPADLFSWAATLAYAATGQPPFGGETGRVREGSADLTGLPPELAALLTSCLGKNPHERPDTKAAMLRLLGERSVPLTPAEGDRTAGSGTERNSPEAAVPAAVADASARPTALPLWGAPTLPGST